MYGVWRKVASHYSSLAMHEPLLVRDNGRGRISLSQECQDFQASGILLERRVAGLSLARDQGRTVTPLPDNHQKVD